MYGNNKNNAIQLSAAYANGEINLLHHTKKLMQINHKLLRHAGIELAITTWRVVQADHFHPNDVGNMNAVPHDRPHQLAVVLHDRGLAGVEAVGFGPAQAKADVRAAHRCDSALSKRRP